MIRAADVVEPEPASWDELALVHTAEYLEGCATARCRPKTSRSSSCRGRAEMVEGFRLMVGGTIQAALIACGIATTIEAEIASTQRTIPANSADSAFEVACHIGGGLHHAFPNHGEGLLSVQRRRGRGARAAGARRRAGRDRRPRRPPRQRHRVHLRIRSARLHLLDAPAAQLPDVEAARIAGHRPAGRRARRDVSRRARARAAGGDGAARRSACSISPAPIRTRTISWAACG